jgi:hypothetical protein
MSLGRALIDLQSQAAGYGIALANVKDGLLLHLAAAALDKFHHQFRRTCTCTSVSTYQSAYKLVLRDNHRFFMVEAWTVETD